MYDYSFDCRMKPMEPIANHCRSDLANGELDARQIAQIQEATKQLLSSPDFISSKRLSDFLTYVVNKTLAGRGSEIKAYSVAVDVFGRAADFDPQKDPSVRAHAGRLRRALERYYLTNAPDQEVEIQIPKGAYVPKFIFREDAEIPLPRTTRTRSLAPSLILTLFSPDPVRPDYAHFATGIAQEMAVRLSRFKDFVVIGPVDPSDLPASTDAAASAEWSQGIRFALEGSLRIHDDQLRLRVILRELQSDHIVYADSHDARLDPEAILSMEESLADRITSAIAGECGVLVRSIVEQTHGRTVETLEDYEAAMLVYHWNTVMTDQAFGRALQALESSVQRSSDSARNLALLADIYCVDYFSHLGLVENNLQRAVELATLAARASPDLQETRWVMGQVRFLTREFPECRREFAEAIELNPYNPNTLAVVGLFLAMMGSWEEGMSMTTEALQRNPHHPGWYPFVPALHHLRQRDYPSALKEADRLNTPGLLWGPAVRAAVHGYLGDTERAFKEKEALLALHPTFVEKPKVFIERLLHSDENIDLIMDGLSRCKFSPTAPFASSASTLG